MDIQQSCFSGVMLAVGRLVGIEKTNGDKVISKSTRSIILDMRDRLEIGR